MQNNFLLTGVVLSLNFPKSLRFSFTLYRAVFILKCYLGTLIKTRKHMSLQKAAGGETHRHHEDGL